MNRTLKGFLKRYCAELSGLNTTSLRRLCAAAHENARLVEPLFLLAAEQGKTGYLTKLAEGAWFHDDYERLAMEIERDASEYSFLKSDMAPPRYKSVLDAFEAQGDALAADRRMNSLLRPKIIAALERSGLTRYRLCKDLGLNAGNVYAYLAGDDTKLSNATARRILEYTSLQS